MAKGESTDKKTLLICVTTCDQNVGYFKLCYDSLKNLEGDYAYKIMVVDFSDVSSEKIAKALIPTTTYISRPGSGFCANLNFAFSVAMLADFDFVAHVNDDVRVPSYFFQEGISVLSQGKGFVAGVQQETSRCLFPVEEFARMCFADPKKEFEQIDTLQGKWGDFSAWIAPVDLIRAVGNLDETFDPVGIIADNDYLWRIRRLGFKAIRNYAMPYLHAKGVTQRTRRPGFPYDDVGIKNRAYFKKKWGVDPYSGFEAAIFELPFHRNADYEEEENGL